MGKTILFICNEYPPYRSGGIGYFVKNLAEQLTQENYRCIVAGLYDLSEELVETIEGVTVYRFRNQKKTGLFHQLRQSYADKCYLSRCIQSIEKNHTPDLIESFEWSGPLGKKPKTTLLIRLHGSHTVHAVAQHKKTSRWVTYWEKKNCLLADHIVSVSEYMLQASLAGFHFSVSSEVIYNGINCQFFKPNEEFIRREKEILFAGRFHEQKGVYEIPALLKILFEKDAGYRFFFVGHHTEEQKKSWLALFSLEHQVRIQFISGVTQHELLGYYQTCGLVLVPSRGEAFGLVCAEAMACGALTAMHQAASAPELIDDEINGLLMDINNPEQAADKIHRILQSSQKEEIRRQARMKVLANFSNDVILNKNKLLYQQLGVH